MNLLLALTISILFAIGVFQILRRDLIKAAMGFAILFTAVNLFLLSMGAYNAEVPAYSGQIERGQVSDPLVQAVVLTAIVVGFGAYALLFAMVNMISRRFDTLDSDQVDQLQN